MVITIKGEAGKPFDATVRNFNTVAVRGQLSFNSMSRDTLSFDMIPASLTGADLDIPDEGQTIELFFDGVRHFKGTVTAAPGRWSGKELFVGVTVIGPWHYMEKTALSDLFSAVERPQFECAAGDLRANIIRFLNRAITLGVPIAIGTIDPIYACPRITLRDGSLAYGLSELVRQVPDAIGWFDYAVAGDPEFNLTRRAPGASTDLAFGADDVTEVNLEAQYELLVKKVTVPYASRNAAGVTTLTNQVSTSGAAGALQTVALSGPELFDYEPLPITLDLTSQDETYTVTSKELINSIPGAARNGGSNVNDTDLELWWPFYRGWKAKYENAPDLSFLHWNSLRNSGPQWSPNPFTEGVTLVVTDDDGNVLQNTTSRKYAIVENGSPFPYWLWDELGAERYRMAGHFYIDLQSVASPTPDWVIALRQEAAKWRVVVGGPDNNDNYIAFESNFDVILIDKLLTGAVYNRSLVEAASATTNYTYEAPPAGYAQNLKDAQAWLPYKGEISLRPASGGLTRYSGSTVNLIGGLPKWTNMGALIQGEDFDLNTRQHTLKAGLPARFSGATSATRIDSRPNNNILQI